MKKKWTQSWNSSIQPRKQRKYRINAPLHKKADFLHAHLSKELIKKYGTRAVQLKKGDKVKIMRGSYKGKIGTIDHVEIKKSKVFITEIEVIKRDGSKTSPAFQPSNLMITELKMDDKRREKQFTRSKNKKE